MKDYDLHHAFFIDIRHIEFAQQTSGTKWRQQQRNSARTENGRNQPQRLNLQAASHASGQADTDQIGALGLAGFYG